MCCVFAQCVLLHSRTPEMENDFRKRRKGLPEYPSVLTTVSSVTRLTRANSTKVRLLYHPYASRYVFSHSCAYHGLSYLQSHPDSKLNFRRVCTSWTGLKPREMQTQRIGVYMCSLLLLAPLGRISFIVALCRFSKARIYWTPEKRFYVGKPSSTFFR